MSIEYLFTKNKKLGLWNWIAVKNDDAGINCIVHAHQLAELLKLTAKLLQGHYDSCRVTFFNSKDK